MSDYKPSDFVKLGHPSCSRWGKCEIESMAEAYVKALAADGDVWKRLARQRVCELLGDSITSFERSLLADDYYDHWFEMVADQITDSDGALGVRGFWSEFQLTRATSGKRDVE
jgi:hypothetical protein